MSRANSASFQSETVQAEPASKHASPTEEVREGASADWSTPAVKKENSGLKDEEGTGRGVSTDWGSVTPHYGTHDASVQDKTRVEPTALNEGDTDKTAGTTGWDPDIPAQGRQSAVHQEKEKSDVTMSEKEYVLESQEAYHKHDNENDGDIDFEEIGHDKKRLGSGLKEREYTPELPVAEGMEMSRYNSPELEESEYKVVGASRESVTETRLLPQHHRVGESGQEGWGMPTATAHGGYGTNRVVPADEETVERSRLRGHQPYPMKLEKKKSFIIGAEENIDGPGCCGWILYLFSVLLIIISLPFSLVFCIKVVQEYERAVIFRLGRLPSGGAKGPGIFFIIPCIESYSKVDLRTVSFDVPPQEVLTKDSVTVSVDAVVYYRVSNPTVSVANVENAHHSTRLLAQTTLRNILGTKNMSEILSDRESISQGMQSTLDEATDRWGIKVERVEIKDVRLPVQLQRAMAAEAEAAREARAKVIAAEGEHKASRALKEAADVMSQSSAALQLRYLQTLASISAEKNSTIIFPLPLDLLKGFINKKS